MLLALWLFSFQTFQIMLVFLNYIKLSPFPKQTYLHRLLKDVIHKYTEFHLKMIRQFLSLFMHLQYQYTTKSVEAECIAFRDIRAQ